MNQNKIDNIIEMKNITKIFPGVIALDDVHFEVQQGEIRGLVGKNGAGKSTLMNILTGIYSPNNGELFIEGKRITNMNSTLAKKLGISYVHQHSQLIPSLSMAENIFCGNLPKNKFGLIDWDTLNKEADKLVTRLGLHIDVSRTIEGASVAECQMIEIIKALFANAKIVILDEATAPLPKSEVDVLFKFIHNLQDHGVTFIYISHYLAEVFQLCDSVTVLRDGKNAGDFKVSQLTQEDLVTIISGSKLKQYHRKAEKKTGNRPILEIKDLTKSKIFQGINLSLYPGEIVGITGLDGCGKDNLAKTLFGLEEAGTGEIWIDNQKIQEIRSPSEAFKKGIAYLPRDRHGYGIVGIRPVRENVTLPILQKLLTRIKLLDLSKEKDHVLNMINQLYIKTPSQEQLVTYLSGGNQQKVVFAKLIGTEPKVLFLDEPTQGIDVQAKEEILRIIDDLSQKGTCIVLISEEISELLKICNRIIVMFGGKLIREFKKKDRDMNYQKILMAVEGN